MLALGAASGLAGRQVACGRFEEFPPASARLLMALAGIAQVSEVGVTDAAANRPQMKLDVVTQGIIHRAQQVGPQLRTRETAQLSPPPDLADRMPPLIAATNEQCGLLSQGTRARSCCSMRAARSADRASST